jgi:hypothetical protein
MTKYSAGLRLRFRDATQGSWRRHGRAKRDQTLLGSTRPAKFSRIISRLSARGRIPLREAESGRSDAGYSYHVRSAQFIQEVSDKRRQAASFVFQSSRLCLAHSARSGARYRRERSAEGHWSFSAKCLPIWLVHDATTRDRFPDPSAKCSRSVASQSVCPVGGSARSTQREVGWLAKLLPLWQRWRRRIRE